MKDINLLREKLKVITAEGFSEEAFHSVIKEVTTFYIDTLQLSADEVAILLTDREKIVLSFAYPPHLVDSGLIPTNSPDAFASNIFRLNRGIVENNFNQQKHLHLFEYVKTSGQKVKPIWKLMGTVLRAGADKFGVIEISRKAIDPKEPLEDFSTDDLRFLDETIGMLAPFIRKVAPDDFRGKLT